jgi:DNA-binding ferritin-like protein (Dps family)
VNVWKTMTGSDMTRDWKVFEVRAAALPADYRAAWEEINASLFAYGDFTGRNLMPILDDALRLLEETAANGQSIHEVVGDDIKGFCAALAGVEGAKTYRDRWREQVNKNVAKKLRQLGGEG